MRILQINSAREIGGGERHLVDLINTLSRDGHEVFAAVNLESPLVPELSTLPRGHVIHLPFRNWWNFRSAMELAKFVRARRIQIVHAHVARDYPLAALAARRTNTRLVLTRHVLFPLNR